MGLIAHTMSASPTSRQATGGANVGLIVRATLTRTDTKTESPGLAPGLFILYICYSCANEARHRRVARKGEDYREVSQGDRLQGKFCRARIGGPRARPAQEQQKSHRYRGWIYSPLRSRAGQSKSYCRVARAIGGGRRSYIGDRPRPRGRGHCVAHQRGTKRQKTKNKRQKIRKNCV